MKTIIISVCVLLLLSVISGCTDDDSAGSGEKTLVVSNLGHHGSTTLTTENIVNDQAGDYTTSDDGHLHTFTLTSGHITQLKAGGSVNITTTSDSGHTHTITLNYQ